MKLVRTQNRQTTGPDALGAANNIMAMSDLADDAGFLESQLPGALDRGELSLYYQPQFQLPDVRMVGSEALLRWNHPERGMISPARFIPIAEESGFIVPIGTWVLQEACRQNYLWQRAGYDPIRVAVNISAQQFAQIDFVSAVEQALSSTGLEARYLELELAEPVLMRSVQVAARRLLNLKALGVRLSMDDVGTGVLSLKEMVGLPVDALKIDVPFVRGMNETPGTLRLVKAILGLGHSLGMDVIAEGVETEEQLEQLRQLGCDKAQGYLFSAAVTAGDSEAYQTPASTAPDQEEPL
jgi:EAL domain-containing protein (putative c-di-GMP-specific phosphodiesterase class I)